MPAIAIILFSLFPALYFFLSCWLAIWLAFGRIRFVFRLPLFLLGSFVMGWLFAVVASHSSQAMGIVLGTSFATLALIGMRPLAKIGIIVTAALTVFAHAWFLTWTQIDPGWIVWITLCICSIALILAGLRFIGYRLINISGFVGQEAFERSTGKSLDEWFQTLNQAGAKQWDIDELRTHVRECGLDDLWQTRIASAYSLATEWKSDSSSDSGEQWTVVQNPNFRIQSLIERMQEQRFTIRDIMKASFAVALICAYARSLSGFELRIDSLSIGTPVVITLAVACALALVRLVGLRTVQYFDYVLVALTILSPCVLLRLLQLRSIMGIPVGVIATFELLTALLIGIYCRSLRGQGYRFVQLKLLSNRGRWKHEEG